MRRSVRLRLLASHILPIIILIPLLGVGLLYLLDEQVFLPMLSKDMLVEGTILTSSLHGNPQVWRDPAAAQSVLDHLDLPGSLRVELLGPGMRLLASNQPGERFLVDHPLTGIPGGNKIASKAQWKIGVWSPGSPPALDMIIPVKGSNNQILGELRLTRSLATLNSGLWKAIELTTAAVLLGLLVNGLLGWYLSARITRPLRLITQAITTVGLEGSPKRISNAGIDELDALAQAFNRLQENRYEIESGRQQMLANLVHELGRPLGSLRAAIHALLAGAQTNAELRMDLLQGMTDRIETLGKLVEDLSLAYLPHRSLELRQVPFAPATWLNSMVPLWAEMARQKSIQWNAVWPEDLPTVEGDPARLEQALSNLVSNALKFTPPGGRVSLNAGEDQGQFWVTVADNGPGICQADLQHLFEPFFRAAPTALKVSGLGLGLSISRTIVEAHGGSIDVRSRPGSGCVFTLCVPHRADPDQREPLLR